MILPVLKKYGKYVVIAIVGVGSIVLFVMVYSWLKKSGKADDGQEHVETLGAVIEEIGAKLTEANHQAVVEVVAARSGEAEIKEELAVVVNLENKVTRRRKLAELYAKVSG